MDPITIVMPALFILIGFVVWIAVTGWQRRQHVKLLTDFNARLLDRIGSVKDFSDFVQTGAGADFMKSLASDMPASKPQDRIIRAVQIGIVSLSLGIGLFGAGEFISFAEQESQQFFRALGVIIVSLGGGFLISAVAAYRLASKFGVLKRGE